ALIRTGGAFALAATLVLAGCSSTPEEEPEPTGDAAVVTPTPEPSAEPEPEPEPVPDPTCETIIPESLVADFADAGWTFSAEAFHVGEVEIPGGIMCTWGDFDVPSDHVQMFGWAPIDESLSTELQQTLVTYGWQRIEGEDGVFLTEDPDIVSAPDDEGYGLTYQFGDGWVIYADT